MFLHHCQGTARETGNQLTVEVKEGSELLGLACHLMPEWHMAVEDLCIDLSYLIIRLEFNCLKSCIDVVMLLHTNLWRLSETTERLLDRGIGK